MYEDRTPEEIRRAILSGMKTDIDKREGSFASDMAGPVSLELYRMYAALNAVPDMVWVNETSRGYLDLAAEDIGIDPRKEGTRAVVALEITGRPGASIPRGKLFRTEAGLNFAGKESALIPEGGTLSLEAESEEAGIKYNVPAGSILYQYDNDPNIASVTNPAAAEGGTEPESDAALYERITAARRRPSASGNRYDYERWALEVPGVGAAHVFPLWNGNGTVKVLVVDEEHRPVDQAVLDRCREHIEEVRPIGAAVTVVTAAELTVDITADVEVTETAAAVRAQFQKAVNGYFSGIAFYEYEIVLNQVGGLLIRTDGVSDYTNLKLNGKAENIALTSEQVPKIGEITLNEVSGNVV